MPHDRNKYPADWPEISARIRKRDGHRCVHCGVADRAIGYWEPNQAGSPPYAFVQIADDGDDAVLRAAADLHGRRVIQILLTVAHIDNRDPMDCRPENLAALCQRCHLAHDREHHLRNASRTRAIKKGRGTYALFEDTDALARIEHGSAPIGPGGIDVFAALGRLMVDEMCPTAKE